MLAEHFGYAVSPVPAERVSPGVLEALRAERHTARRLRYGVPAVVVPGAAVMEALLRDLTAAMVGLVMVLTSMGCDAVTSVRRRETARTLATQPWQVWPARLAEVPDRPSQRRLSLLAPDRTVAAAFTGRVPLDVWEAMTDGHGLVWFAGDLRFGGVVTLPGSSRHWTVKPAPPEPAKPARAGPSLEDELIREAGKAAAWNVLG